MLTQLLGWLAVTIGWTATALIPHTRHAWLIGIAAAAVWLVVDTRLHLWAGVTAAAVAAGLNARCWHRHVTARRSK